MDSENQWFHTELPEVPHTSFVITAQYVNEQKLQHISVKGVIGECGGCKSFWCFSDDCELLHFKAPLCRVKDHLFKSAAVVFLSLIIHSSVSLCPPPPQPLIFGVHDLSLMDSVFSLSFLSTFFSLTFPPSSSKLSSLWALIDISLLTFSFTLTLMCAALSDAQVVWSFIRPHSLRSSFPPGYSSLLPVLWKSSFPLQNPCGLIWETPRPRSHCSSQRERIETTAPSGGGQRDEGVCLCVRVCEFSAIRAVYLLPNCLNTCDNIQWCSSGVQYSRDSAEVAQHGVKLKTRAAANSYCPQWLVQSYLILVFY